MPAKLHLTENPLALHLLFQRLEGLVNVVIPNENLHEASSFHDLQWGWGSAAAISPRLLPSYGAFSRIIVWSPTIVSGMPHTCGARLPGGRSLPGLWSPLVR